MNELTNKAIFTSFPITLLDIHLSFIELHSPYMHSVLPQLKSLFKLTPSTWHAFPPFIFMCSNLNLEAFTFVPVSSIFVLWGHRVWQLYFSRDTCNILSCDMQIEECILFPQPNYILNGYIDAFNTVTATLLCTKQILNKCLWNI